MISERFRGHFLPALLLITATLAVYARTLGHDFLMNWDDSTYVTANRSVHGFSLENVRVVFTNFYAGNYAPLQMLSYMLDYTLWGLWPGGFLLTNVALHAVNGLLLYMIILKTTSEKLVAIVAAGIFLLHPVQVESVAWISQRKNLLAMFFMLLSWWGYICSRNSAKGGWGHAYFLSVAAFLCSLLSKSATVFFPIALVLYEGCFPATERRSKLLDKIPFLVLSLVAALLAMHSQSHDVKGLGSLDYGGRSSWHGGTPWTTFLTMLPVLCSYLRMIVWPSGLSADYSPAIYTSIGMPVIAALIVLLCCAWLVCRLYRVNRRIGYWPLFSILAILPVVQIVPLVTLMNDRYLYFPMIGVAALGGTGAIVLKRLCPEKVASGITLVVLLLLALVSYERSGVWKNSRTLWIDATQKVPDKHEAWEGLGEAYHFSVPVMLKDADYAYSRAFALYSSDQMNLFNLARVKLQQGDDERGMTLLQRLLKINPEHVMGWAAFGDIYVKQQKYREAENAYKRAETLQPEAVEVTLRLYRLYVTTGDIAAARLYYERFLVLGGDISALNP
jgi:hypothetical protein